MTGKLRNLSIFLLIPLLFSSIFSFSIFLFKKNDNKSSFRTQASFYNPTNFTEESKFRMIGDAILSIDNLDNCINRIYQCLSISLTADELKKNIILPAYNDANPTNKYLIIFYYKERDPCYKILNELMDESLYKINEIQWFSNLRVYDYSKPENTINTFYDYRTYALYGALGGGFGGVALSFGLLLYKKAKTKYVRNNQK